MSQLAVLLSGKPVASPASRTRSAVLQRQCACGQHAMGGECDQCRKKHSGLQRKAAGEAPANAPSVVGDVLRSQRQPLDPAVREFMEPRFGRDFSSVRVHTGARAAESAYAVRARAYTVGTEMVFGQGQYRPRDREGRRLIAHELSHVLQQEGQSGAAQAKLTVNEAGDRYEQEADRVADQVISMPLAPRTNLQSHPAAPPGTFSRYPSKSSGLLRQSRGPVIRLHASGELQRDAADASSDEPASLHTSFDPKISTYDQLMEELGRIQHWLEAHSASSEDRTRLESLQTEIIATMKRIDERAGRSPLRFADIRPFSKSPQQTEESQKTADKFTPPASQPAPFGPAGPAQQAAPKAESPLEKFTREHAKEIGQFPQWSEHFANGLMRSPVRAKLGEAWDQLKSDLTSVKRVAAFYMGLNIGVPAGAIKDLYGQAEAVVLLAVKAFILKTKIEADPMKVWLGLLAFVRTIPSLLVRLLDAEQLGQIVGERLAAQIDQDFVKKDALDQGRAIGEIIGAVLMEVALLFVGFEEISAGIKALRATVVGEEVAHGMALTSRELKVVLEAEKVLTAETDVAKGASKATKEMGAAGGVEKGAAQAEKEAAANASPSKSSTPGAADAVEREIKSLGPMDAASEQMLRNDPELRRAFAENPLAADALKLCKSPCLPSFATSEQVRRLNKTLEKFKQAGIKIEMPKLKEYLHAQRDHPGLTDALDRLDESYTDITSRGEKAAGDQFVSDARKLEEELGVREKKPPGALESEAAEGRQFDRERRRAYPANEVPIRDKGGVRRRLDSYDPVKGEIVSRKSLAATNGQIAMVNEFTMIDYFQEFSLKYPNGATIADGPRAGQIVKGKYILEVPVQEYAIPQRIQQEARVRNITIRDIAGKTY